MEQLEITKEEFLEWQNLKVTQEVIKAVEMMIEDVREAMATGETLVPHHEGVVTAKYVGRIEGLRELANIRHNAMEILKRDGYDH